MKYSWSIHTKCNANITPSAVATPRPPLKLRKGEVICPKTELIPVKAAHSFNPECQVILEKNSFDSYFFLCDLDGHIEEPKVQKSLEELGLHCQDFHVLGVFEADKIREK